MGSAGMLLLLLLLQGAVSNDQAQEPGTMEEAILLAQKNAEEGVYDQDGHSGKFVKAASVDIHNGHLDRVDTDQGNDPHTGGMEDILQEIQSEVEEADFLPPGDVLSLEEKLAAEYLKGTRTGAVSIQHTFLELPPDDGVSENRTKRQVVSRNSRWSKGVIPYSFTTTKEGESMESEAGQANIKRAFDYFEMTTCLKFPKWTSTLNQELGREDPHFLRFIVPDEGGCWSFVGMGAGYTKGKGQAISACGGYGVAIHEIGHAIGFAHEQNRGDRYLYVKMFPENADDDHQGTFKGAPNTGLENVHPYDFGSIMHYSRYGFSHTGLPTLSALDDENNFLIGNKEDAMSFYDLMGITDYYDCREHCTAEQKALECKNDGFVNMECKCQCPWMFSGDLCDKLKKPDAGPTDWPAGSYGIVQTLDGCPGEGWDEGSRAHPMDGKSHLSGTDLLKPVSAYLTTDYFCMRSQATSTTPWPKGTYCIYQKEDTCPDDFTSGWLSFDDANDREGAAVNGTLPKGKYDNDTVYYYCCRSDGPPSKPMVLPRSKPFVLPRHEGSCQAVEGMGVKGATIHYDLEDTDPNLEAQAPYPSLANWWKNYWIYYCYYYPINYDCGGEITLTVENPSKEIITPNYPADYDNAKECIWHIKHFTSINDATQLKGPKHLSMAIDFDDMDIETDTNNNCVDSVEVRHTLLAQPGERYCGKDIKTSFISDAGFAMIIFRSDYKNQRKGFQATARIVKQDEQCYNPLDKGASYMGKIDYTEHYFRCIPWEKAQHCDVNPFDIKYINSGLVGHNHCRNPNGLLRPWCYVNEYCEIDHCDVCNFGKCYDYYDDCAELLSKDSTFCDTDEAFHGCHKSCNKCGAELDNSVKKCSAPKLEDKNAYIAPPDDAKTSFDFGDKITLRCKNVPNGEKISSELTCTTDGEFVGQQIFCGVGCEDGYVAHRDSCYKLDKSAEVFYPEAKEKCAAEGGTIVGIRNKEENDFVQSFAAGTLVWIGINDMDRNDEWLWEDNSTSGYLNWKPGEPSGGSEGCGIMEKDGTWNDVYCDIHYTRYTMCKKAKKITDEDYYCTDENPECFNIIERNYKMCSQYRDYSFVNCRRACAYCPAVECIHPGTATNAVAVSPTNYIDAGHYLEFKCNSGFELESGHLGRACLREGLLTGSQAKCLPEDQFEDRYGYRAMPRAKTESVGKLSIYNATEAVIGRHGKALRWEVYSTTRTVLVAQVWRKTTEDDKFTLIGQTWINLRPRRVTVHKLKTFETFIVQPGDFIGWYTPVGSKGLTYSNCDETYSTSRIVHQVSMKEMGSVQVGMELTAPVIDKCRTYSIGLVVGKGSDATDINVASLKYGGKCLDASSNKDICNLALDSVLTPHDGAWISNNEGKGAFIKIGFNAAYKVMGARFMQGLSKKGQIKTVTLAFSDGSTQKVGLNERQGTSATDSAGMEWDSFDLTPVETNEVTVTVDSIYSQDNNGFIEVEIYASCMAKWNAHGEYCYKVETENKNFENAEESCAETSYAHLASVADVAENTFVAALAKEQSVGDIWIGKNDRATEGTYIWTDGSSSGYTNWKSGEPSSGDCVWINPSAEWDVVSCTYWPRASMCKRKIDISTTLPYSVHGNEVKPRGRRDYSNELGDIMIEQSDAMKIPKSGSIQAWKLYAHSATEITMRVMRLVDDMTFTLVGENTIRTVANRTAIIDIPEFARINVEAGDYVAWSYIPTELPPLQYTYCKSSEVSMMVIFYDRSSSESLAVGQKITGRQKTYYDCRIYSIGYIMNEEQVNDVNVASTSKMTTCSGASSNPSICGLVLDGLLRPWDSAWNVEGNTGIGAWIQIQFASECTLVGARIMQNFNKNAQIKALQLDFGNSREQEVQLINRQGSKDLDFKVQVWDTFSIDPVISTNNVKITIKSAYTDGLLGLVEVEFYSNGCPVGWTRYGTNCYKLYDGPKFYAPAEEDCVAEGAHISSVLDQAENDFLVKISMGKHVYLGYTLQGSTWVAADGSSFNYTNWLSGQPDGASNSEYCISLTTDGKWGDNFCQWHYPRGYVCKKPMLTSQPTVSTNGNPVQPGSNTDGSGSVANAYIERTDSLKVPNDGSILAWKIYTSKSVNINFMAMRPVDNDDTKYTIVGENLVKTPDGKTDIITVPDIFRINVKAGDYIGWYYLSGSENTLPYDTCSASTKPTKYQYVKHDSSPWIVGTELTFKTGTWRPCRTYSVSYLLDNAPAPETLNIAKGSPCTASTESDICYLAVDGGLYAYDSAWVSKGEHVGAWLELTFPAKYPVIGGRLQQRYSSASRISEIEFSFDDGSKQKIQFGSRVGESQTDYTVQAWDAFTFSTVATQSVKATVTGTNSSEDVGFVELELISTGCPEGWTRDRTNCYKFYDVAKFYVPAEEDCVAEGAHISSVLDKAENDFLVNMAAGKLIYLGYNLVDQTTWVAADGSTYGYTNWVTGQPDGASNSEYCIRMNTDGKWIDQYCQWHYARRYICKKSILQHVEKTTVGERTDPRKYGTGNNRLYIANKAENRFTKDGTVVGWKVFGKTNNSAVMLVWRPVPNSDPTEFTLIGANTVQTVKDRTTITQVPRFTQINAKAGDVIGLQLSGGSNAIYYDSCTGDGIEMTQHRKDSGWSFPQVGQTLEIPVTTNCRSYSVEALVEPAKEALSFTNIAAISSITTCEASVNTDTCGKVIDNDLDVPTGEWKTADTVVGSWVKLTFNEKYKVKYISIAQRLGSAGQSKDITLEFSDSTTETVTLVPRLEGSFTEKRNGYWDDFELSQAVETNSIKFTIASTFTESENGFVEIRVWAGCAVGWERYEDSCYYLSTERTHFFQAKDACTALGANLTRVDSAGENAFIRKLGGPTGNLRIGFRDNYQRKPDQVWSWEDGGTITYTNWREGCPSNSDTWGYCAYVQADGTWRDAYCKWFNEVPYVCEKPAPGTTSASRRSVPPGPPPEPPQNDDKTVEEKTHSGKLLRLMARKQNKAIE